MKVACLGRYSKTPMSPFSSDTPADQLEKLGLEITSSLKDADVVVFFEFYKKDFLCYKKSEARTKPSLLITMEPKVVIPWQNVNLRNKSFDASIALGRPPKDDLQTLNWPQPWRLEIDTRDKTIADKAVMVSSNKLSLVKGELYSLRRECAFKLDNLDVYGRAWDIDMWSRAKILLSEALRSLVGGYLPKFKSTKYWFNRLEPWISAPEDKDSVLRNYKACVVIENSQEYLTEKIFDSFFAGSIPIYVGPNLDLFGIPAHLAVQVDPGVNCIQQGIKLALEMNYEKWQSDVKSWIESPQTISSWSQDSIYQRITLEISRLHKNS